MNAESDAAQAAGIRMDRRRGAFSGRRDWQRTSEHKGAVRLWLERVFLATLPLYCRVLSFVAGVLLRLDLLRFRPPLDRPVLVVSHTAIRLLAFALGHLHTRIEDIHIPTNTQRAQEALVAITGVRAFVLDIDHETRERRMHQRRHRGTMDNFDAYLGQDPLRSERIEEFLVWIGVHYLGAKRIENNALANAELLVAMGFLQNV